MFICVAALHDANMHPVPARPQGAPALVVDPCTKPLRSIFHDDIFPLHRAGVIAAALELQRSSGGLSGSLRSPYAHKARDVLLLFATSV